MKPRCFVKTNIAYKAFSIGVSQILWVSIGNFVGENPAETEREDSPSGFRKTSVEQWQFRDENLVETEQSQYCLLNILHRGFAKHRLSSGNFVGENPAEAKSYSTPRIFLNSS